MDDKILFYKLDILSLKKQGFLCADMHYHTVHSDGAASVSSVIEKARKLGIGIAITDHNEISGSLEGFIIKQEDDFLIPGTELKSCEGIDLLFYFYSRESMKDFFEKEILPNRRKTHFMPKLNLNFPELVELSKKYECITSLAHPFGYSMRGGKDIFKIDSKSIKNTEIVEVINGGNGRKKNIQAIEYAKNNQKKITAGTDGHSIYPLGNIVTYSKANNLRGFLDNIKSGNSFVCGIETRLGKYGEYFNFGRNKIRNFIGHGNK
jgi:predicted metal-dependent phosphoesterase TrpH